MLLGSLKLLQLNLRPVKFMSDKFAESAGLCKQLQTEADTIIKANNELQIENSKLTIEFNLLKGKIRSLEQYSRVSNTEISGLPLTMGALGVNVRDGDIAAIHSLIQEGEPTIWIVIHSSEIIWG